MKSPKRNFTTLQDLRRKSSTLDVIMLKNMVRYRGYARNLAQQWSIQHQIHHNKTV